MTRAGWWMFCLLARALQAAEGDVVLGDALESGGGLGGATCDVLGLIVRRQAGLWTRWQPWLALLGVGVLAGAPLSRIAFGFNVDVRQQFMAYRQYGVRFETGLSAGQEMTLLVCQAAALLVWSGACGFALGSLSGRAAWLTWCVFYLVVSDWTWAKFIMAGNVMLRDPGPLRLLMAAALPLGISAMLFLLPSLIGAREGARWRALQVRRACLLGAVVLVLTILLTWMSGWRQTAHAVWSGGVWRGVSVSWPIRMMPFLLVSWPTAYLVAKSYRNVEEKTI